MIDKATFNAQLEKETTDSLPSSQYDELLEEYPYFQAARALYLKALKKENSFSYNHALKVTAAYTEDRGVLFDYITSPVFKQLEKARQIKIRLSEELESDLSLAPEEASKVFDPDLFQPEKAEEPKASELEDSNAADQNQAPVTEDVLESGRPLTFDRQETHSFSEWLKLTQAQPIDRAAAKAEEISTGESSTVPPKKFELIDKFIASNPKIIPSKEPVGKPEGLQTTPLNTDLMTETLARVYLEQKNYSKAIQAFKILILKNPEKSSLFADQIRAIEKLQEKH